MSSTALQTVQGRSLGLFVATLATVCMNVMSVWYHWRYVIHEFYKMASTRSIISEAAVDNIDLQAAALDSVRHFSCTGLTTVYMWPRHTVLSMICKV